MWYLQLHFIPKSEIKNQPLVKGQSVKPHVSTKIDNQGKLWHKVRLWLVDGLVMGLNSESVSLLKKGEGRLRTSTFFFASTNWGVFDTGIC